MHSMYKFPTYQHWLQFRIKRLRAFCKAGLVGYIKYVHMLGVSQEEKLHVAELVDKQIGKLWPNCLQCPICKFNICGDYAEELLLG